MNLLKGKSNKILFIGTVIINVIAVIFVVILVSHQNAIYNSEVNHTLENIISEIEAKYPHVDEEEIMKILNNKNSPKKQDSNILQQYGITDENAILKLQTYNKDFIIKVFIVVTITCIFFITMITIYIRKRNQRIEELIQYIEQMTRKNYALNIQDNSEDELSNLRNELYKITIMLKEQAELEQKEKQELSVSLSDISHQLKTPLTSISILLENMQQNADMEKEIRVKFIHEISRQIDWINWLVISLLKLSKIDANVVLFKKETIYIKQLIENVIQNVSIPLEIKNQELCVEGNPELTFVGDYHWTLEALLNIVKNCIEHTSEGKKIYISFEKNSLYTKITIKDEGIGIAKEDIPHIFERFYKGKYSSESSIGIGLALSKTIIEKQGGYISVKSKENKGTIFEIKMP